MTLVLARPILEPVSCFLLTWNPERWDWTTLADDLVHVALGRAVEIRWSSGNTRRVVAGDRVFLLKQGTPPRGLEFKGSSQHIFDLSILIDLGAPLQVFSIREFLVADR